MPHNEGNAWGFGKFMRKNSLLDMSEDLLPNDTLTIRCDILIRGEEKQASGSKYLDDLTLETASLPQRHQTLARNLRQLLNSEEGSDIEVICSGRVFRCH